MNLSSLVTRCVGKWQIILSIVLIIKILVTVLTPPKLDLMNWTWGAAYALEYLAKGQPPPISEIGVYGPIQILLVPFYWLWTRLPIEHPAIEYLTFQRMMMSNSPAARLLTILMKLPPFSADLVTGVLIWKFTNRLTHSQTKSKLACLAWFVNPYNIYWINDFGAMDVIPTLFLILAIMLGSDDKWFRSGLGVSVATILRIFPIFTFPFFLPAVKSRIRGRVLLVSGFLIPIAALLIVLFTTGAGTLSAITQLPQVEYWLLDFLGGNITNVYVKLALVLVPVQFYLIIRYWKKSTLLYMVTVSLLTLLLGAQNTPPHHFLWVSPLLTMCVLISPDETWIFLLTFITASLYLTPIFGLLPFTVFSLVDPFFGGCFYAAKATYLIKLNLENIVTSGAHTLH